MVSLTFSPLNTETSPTFTRTRPSLLHTLVWDFSPSFSTQHGSRWFMSKSATKSSLGSNSNATRETRVNPNTTQGWSSGPVNPITCQSSQTIAESTLLPTRCSGNTRPRAPGHSILAVPGLISPASPPCLAASLPGATCRMPRLPPCQTASLAPT